MADGVVRTLSNVRFVPQLRRKLISLGMLDSMGYTFKSEGVKMEITKSTTTVMTWKMKNDLYFLQGCAITSQTNITKKDDNTELWHDKLAHVSIKGLEELAKKGLLGTYSITKQEKCKHRILGKSKRLGFKSNNHNTTYIMDYVHSDLWGL